MNVYTEWVCVRVRVFFSGVGGIYFLSSLESKAVMEKTTYWVSMKSYFFQPQISSSIK